MYDFCRKSSLYYILEYGKIIRKQKYFYAFDVEIFFFLLYRYSHNTYNHLVRESLYAEAFKLLIWV